MVDEKTIKTTVLIHVGVSSYHFREHILPFYSYCDRRFPIFLNIENYERHDDLIEYFPNLLTSRIAEIYPEVLEEVYIKSIDVYQSDNDFTVKVNAINGRFFAWYVLKNGERVHVEQYNRSNTLKYQYDGKDGEYVFIAFVKDENGEIIETKTQKIRVVNNLEE